MASNVAASEPVVSVIVPAYNAGRFIDECLSSIRRQTHASLEVVVVDDGSTDDTADRAERHAAEDVRVSVLRQPNRGASAARNHGLLRSCGEFVSFFDADDVMYPRSVAVRLTALAWPTAVDVVYVDHDWIDADGHVWSHSDDLELADPPVNDFLASPCISIQGVMIRRELLARSGLFDTAITHAEDWDLWIRLAKVGARFRHVRERLDGYRRHQSNITNNHDQMLHQGLAMLDKHRPRRRALTARRAWRRGRFGLMRGWIWAEWGRRRKGARSTAGVMLRVLKVAAQHPAILAAFPRVVLGSLAKHGARRIATGGRSQ